MHCDYSSHDPLANQMLRMCVVLTLFLSVFVLPALRLHFEISPVCSPIDMGHMQPPEAFTTVWSKLWKAWRNNFLISRNFSPSFYEF